MKERAERFGEKPLSRPPASQAGIPHAVRKSTAHGQWLSWSERRSSQPNRGLGSSLFACVPHADGFIGLLDVPGFGAGAPAPRSCGLPPGHALVPSARAAVVCPATSANLHVPFHAATTTAACSVSARDNGKDIP